MSSRYSKPQGCTVRSLIDSLPSDVPATCTRARKNGGGQRRGIAKLIPSPRRPDTARSGGQSRESRRPSALQQSPPIGRDTLARSEEGSGARGICPGVPAATRSTKSLPSAVLTKSTILTMRGLFVRCSWRSSRWARSNPAAVGSTSAATTLYATAAPDCVSLACQTSPLGPPPRRETGTKRGGTSSAIGSSRCGPPAPAHSSRGQKLRRPGTCSCSRKFLRLCRCGARPSSPYSPCDLGGLKSKSPREVLNFRFTHSSNARHRRFRLPTPLASASTNVGVTAGARFQVWRVSMPLRAPFTKRLRRHLRFERAASIRC